VIYTGYIYIVFVLQINDDSGYAQDLKKLQRKFANVYNRELQRVSILTRLSQAYLPIFARYKFYETIIFDSFKVEHIALTRQAQYKIRS
jgi:hypothetical protein